MEDKTIEIDYSKNNNQVSSQNLNTKDFVNSKFMEQYQIKKHGTTIPTYSPKSFQEQFYFYDDGTNRYLYIYINNTWRRTSSLT